MMSKLFTSLLQAIRDFAPTEPITKESRLEELLMEFLKSRKFAVESQVSRKNDRYDIICNAGSEKVCIELKIKATISDLPQFDRYLGKFPDGLIILCWQASFSVKDIAQNVVEQSLTPVALIELSRKYM